VLFVPDAGFSATTARPGATATNDIPSDQSAVCTAQPMAAGVHYAEFTLLKQGIFGASVGVVGTSFDAAGGEYTRSGVCLGKSYARYSADGWLLYTGGATFVHGRSIDADPGETEWEGMPQPGEMKDGDMVGLLLDLGRHTLSVYLNGSRRGVMVAPGMKNRGGGAERELSAPLRWVVDVGHGASVRIERGQAPPPPTEEEVAAAVAWNAAQQFAVRTGEARIPMAFMI
jgi:hypothetical protein